MTQSIQTSTNKEDYQRSFQEQGFVLRKGFFSKEEVEFLYKEVRNAEALAPSILDKNGMVFREYLHRKSPALQTFLSQKKIVDFVKEFAGPDFWIRKDQAVFKSPGGVEFPWHQDNGYESVQDAYFQFWIAMTEMKPENGGLWVIPGSHRRGLLPHRWIGNHKSWQGSSDDKVSIHAQPGDVLLFSSMLLHRTGPNMTSSDRAAYIVEYMSCKHYDPYAKPPYFMVSRHGEPAPKFVRFYKGNTSIPNQLKYVLPRLTRRGQILKGRLRQLMSVFAG